MPKILTWLSGGCGSSLHFVVLQNLLWFSVCRRGWKERHPDRMSWPPVSSPAHSARWTPSEKGNVVDTRKL